VVGGDFEMAPPVEGNLTECLYDTLGVERNVDPDKLKIAYRKMAMKWHPDKIQQSGAGASADEYQKATERFCQTLWNGPGMIRIGRGF
jgi:DnaJ-class molecular chaperone